MLGQNEALRNAVVEFRGSRFDGGTLEIYTGGAPADPNDPATGTLLCTITLPNPAYGSASGGVVAMSGTWSDTAVDTGTAGYARFISADTLETLDVTVTEDPDDDADLLISDEDIVIGNTVSVISHTLTEQENG